MGREFWTDLKIAMIAGGIGWLVIAGLVGVSLVIR